MKAKKKLAVLAAVVMTAAAVAALPHAAYADETGTVIPRDNITLGYCSALPAAATPEEYDKLNAEQKAVYVKFTAEDENICAVYYNGSGESFIYDGDYVQKGCNISMIVLVEKYVGRNVTVNGRAIGMPNDLSGFRYCGYNTYSNNYMYANNYFFMPYTVGDSDFTVSLSSSDSRTLTEWEKDNFMYVHCIGENVSVYKYSPVEDAIYSYEIEEGDYVCNMNHITEYTQFYAVMTPKDNLHAAWLNVCGGNAVTAELELNDPDTYCLLVSGFENYDWSFTANAAPYTSCSVITADMYGELNAGDKNLYVRLNKDEDVNVWYSYEFNGPTADRQMCYALDGDYIKKTGKYMSARIWKSMLARIL